MDVRANELQSCLDACEEAIKKGSTSFYHAFKHLPSPRKEAVFVIYAFCRIIDDATDEPETSPFTMDELEYQLRHLESANAQAHFIWPALRWLFVTFPALDKGPFLRQMEGQRLDLVLTKYSSFEQLEHYCYLVAGTVGEMLLPVLHNSPTKKVVEDGIALGKAMQIVNIVRDIGEDMRRDRRYIPLDLMQRHHYGVNNLELGIINEKFISMIDELESIADRWFAQGLSDLASYPIESRFAIELAAGYYRAILDEVRANRFNVFTKRAIVGKLAKLKILTSLQLRYPMLIIPSGGDQGAVS